MKPLKPLKNLNIKEKMKLIDELNRKLKQALTELIKKINEASELVKK